MSRQSHNLEQAAARAAPATRRTTMHIQIKHSGNKAWKKITGTNQELRNVSKDVKQPVKPANGKNPKHIDVPIKK